MNLIKLNLARNCIKYLINAYGIKAIFIPYYICDTVWQAIREENCRVSFYHIGADFMPVEKLPQNAYIIYPNYYGLCVENCQKLANLYSNLIVDNTQAFYSEPMGLASFYSLRKFFPVTDGAYLYSDKLLNCEFEKDSIDLPLVSPQQDYKKFVQNELFLNEQKDIKFIGEKVEKQMKNIDFQSDKQQRLYLYEKYYKKYDKYNKIHLLPKVDEIPFCYAFSPVSDEIKNEIISKNIPLIRLWKNMPKNYIEYNILNDVVAMPLNSYSKYFL